MKSVPLFKPKPSIKDSVYQALQRYQVKDTTVRPLPKFTKPQKPLMESKIAPQLKGPLTADVFQKKPINPATGLTNTPARLSESGGGSN